MKNNLLIIEIGETELNKLSEFHTTANNTNSMPPVPNDENLTTTAATLEMSLKNSAEILKQLSSVGNIEDLHKLERQMQESMQLIEKLKSASRQKQQLQHNHSDHQMHQYSPPINQNNCSGTKLRPVNSMPAAMNLVGQPIPVEIKKDG